MNVKISDRYDFQRCVFDSIKNIEKLYNHEGAMLSSRDATVDSKIQKYIFSNFKNETHKKIIKPMEAHSQFEPHSQEEILDLVDEMILRLRGTWVSKPNDNILQDRFWTNLKTWEHFGNWHGEKLLCKVGSKYLNNNQSWLLA